MSSSGTVGSYHNKPFSSIYSMNDPRFQFTSPVEDGSILYYSTVYNKWVNSNANLFKWNDSTGILESYIVSTFAVNLRNVLNNNTKWSVSGGSDYLIGGYNNNPIPSPNGTQFRITDTGLISILGSASGFRLFDRSVNTNYWDTFSTGSTLTSSYNGTTRFTFNSDGAITQLNSAQDYNNLRKTKINFSQSASLDPHLSIINSTGGGGAGAVIDFFTYFAVDRQAGARIACLDNGAYGGDLVFYTKANTYSSAPVERMRLNGGSGGITITGALTTTASVESALIKSTNSCLFQDRTTPANSWNIFSIGNTLTFYYNPSAANRMTLSSDGNLTTTGYISNGSMVMFNNGGTNNYLGTSTVYNSNYAIYTNGTTTILNAGTSIQFRIADNTTPNTIGQITSSGISWNYTTIAAQLYSTTTAVNWNSTVNAIPLYNNGNTQYRLIAQLPEINDGANGMTMTIKGSFGYYGNGNDFTIVIANRGGYTITCTSQGTATITNITNNVDLRIINHPISLFSPIYRDHLYIVIKPNVYPWFDFYVSARDYAGIVYLPSQTSYFYNTLPPGSTVLYSSVLGFCNVTNSGLNSDIVYTGVVGVNGNQAAVRLYSRNGSDQWYIYNTGTILGFYHSNAGRDWMKLLPVGVLQLIHSTTGGTGFYYQQYIYDVSTLIGGVYQNSTTSVQYLTSSDRRLKEDITDITDSGEIIDQLKPRNFTWIASQQKTRGFIADEIQKVIPETVVGEPDAVDADGKPVYQMLDPSGPEMISILVAELQSLRKRVLILETKNTDLETKNSLLEERLTKLEQLFSQQTI